MMDFLSLNPETFSLSVSDLSLRIIKLKRKGRFFDLACFGETEMNPGIIEEGEIKNEEEFLRALKAAVCGVKGRRLKIKDLALSLPDDKAFVTVIQMPKMDKKELESAVPFEVENHIPISVEDVYFDFQTITPVVDSLDHLDLLVAALPRKIIDSYLSCFKKAGLTVWSIETESLSVSRALVKNLMSPFPVLIIDFSKSGANFIIFSGYAMRSSFSGSFSFCQLDAAVSQSLGVDIKEARKIRLRNGITLKGGKTDSFSDKTGRKKASEAVLPFLADLIGQIKKCLAYYRNYHSHEHLAEKSGTIHKILICGEGANTKDLADFLSASLKIPVELANPWINILPSPLKEVPSLSFEESLKYAAPLGLSARDNYD